MATVRLCPIFNGFQGFGNTGLPNNGGQIFTLAAGSSTPQPTYTTSAGNVQNANPIVLDSAGRPPQEVWLLEGLAYKFILADANLNTLATFDNIVGIHDFLAGSPNFTFGGTQTFAAINVQGNLAFTTSLGQRFLADFSNATIANRLVFQSNITNGNTDLAAIPNGSSTQSSWNVFNSADPSNAGFGRIAISNGVFSIQSNFTGGGVTLPMTFTTGSSEAMRITTSQQVLIGTTSAPTNGAVARINGLVQIDNNAAFMAHRNGVDQSGIASATPTQIQLTTTEFNVGSYFNTGTYRFTPPAGYYGILASVGVSSTADGSRYASILYKNGSPLKEIGLVSGGTAASSAGAFAVVNANGTDYFELWFYQSTGGAIAASGSAVDTYFCGFRIG